MVMLPLSWTETDENATNLKLEALWILINLGYAESDDLEKLFMKNQNYDFVQSITLAMS